MCYIVWIVVWEFIGDGSFEVCDCIVWRDVDVDDEVEFGDVY